jgi:osmotically-inducible protein OsmY
MKIPATLLALVSASVLAALGTTACDKISGNETSTTTTTSTAADNTGMNARDNLKDASALTPMSQGNDVADIQTTAAVRRALMADDTLSTNGKNVKVITANGTLTLRGPVDSAGEKQLIDAKARGLAGSNHLDDQLDVAPSK